MLYKHKNIEKSINFIFLISYNIFSYVLLINYILFNKQIYLFFYLLFNDKTSF